MNRIFRLLWLLLRARWAPRVPPLGPATTTLRVWPNDLDLFLHVNNGVYLTLCDLARVDLMLRSGASGLAAGKDRGFMVAGQTIQLYHPLKLFQRFSIDTRVLGWDHKGFFVEHRFRVPATGTAPPGETEHHGETVARAIVEGRLVDRRTGTVSPHDFLASLGFEITTPQLPEWVERWIADQRALRAADRQGAARLER